MQTTARCGRRCDLIVALLAFLPGLCSTLREIARGDVTRDAGFIGEKDLAPNSAVIRGEATLAREAGSVRQTNDDVVIKAGAVAQFEEVIGADTFDHGAGTDGAARDGHEAKIAAK